MRNGMEEATSCGSGRAEDSVRMRLLGPSQDGSGRKTVYIWSLSGTRLGFCTMFVGLR